jgi:hypothetical protein
MGNAASHSPVEKQVRHRPESQRHSGWKSQATIRHHIDRHRSLAPDRMLNILDPRSALTTYRSRSSIDLARSMFRRTPIHCRSRD